MSIYNKSRFTNSYVFSDVRNREIVYLDPIQEPKFQPSQDDLLVEVTQNDRLDLIAHRFYGDSTLDWVLLEANPNLRSPFGVEVGNIVRVPLPEKVGGILV